MNQVGAFQAFRVGIKRRWRSAVKSALAVMGAAWLATEIITRSNKPAADWLDINGHVYLVSVILLSLIAFLAKCLEPNSVSFCLKESDCNLSLKFGDLFSEQSDIVIGVNDLLDTNIGQNVSKNSVHGQLIARVFNGDSIRFSEALNPVRQELPIGTQPDEVPIRYRLGSTGVVRDGARNLYLVVIASTDVQTGKARSSVSTVWDSIQSALKTAAENGHGSPVALPLLGGGRSSLNLPSQHLLRLLVLGIIEATKKHHLPNVNVVLPWDCFSKLDLVEIEKDWSGKSGI